MFDIFTILPYNESTVTSRPSRNYKLLGDDPVKNEQQRFQVFGEIIIPIYFPIREKNKQAALVLVQKILNYNTVSLLEGDLHTNDGKTHIVIAPKCRFNWIEAVSGDGI